MYYYSKNSRRKVIHDGDCFYIQNVDGDSIGIFETLEEAYAALAARDALSYLAMTLPSVVSCSTGRALNFSRRHLPVP